MLTRALLVLLLVLNLGVAAWWWLRPEPTSTPAPAQTAGVPRLRLLSEVAPVPRPAAPPVTEPSSATAPEAAVAPEAAADAPPTGASAEPPNTPSRCFSLGPFPDAAAAASARSRLPADLRSVQTREQPGRSRGNWAVAIAPQADRAAAQALAQRIDAAGFKDYFIVGEGAGANGIALGRFGSQEAAVRHQAALQAAGFSAQLQPPSGSQPSFWLDVEAGPDASPDNLRSVSGAPDTQSRACVAGTAAVLR